MKTRFIRNFTIEPIEFWLQRELRQSGLSIECLFGDFAGAADEIMRLPGQGVDFTVLALGLEMASSKFGTLDWAAEDACARHLMLVKEAVARERGPLVINTVLPPLFPATGLAIRDGVPSAESVVERLNVDLRAIAAANPGRVTLVDWGGIARELGERDTYDYRYWYSSGAPFAALFLRRYAEAIASVARVLAGKVRKCLVLDCDNTLWGGIVGEVGLEGIALSDHDAPGAYYYQFQRAVLDLQGRGVAIAICSKNNAPDVFEVLDTHPDCLLHREHLAAWRIDWEDKARSIASIADELNIGLDSMVFVDDSPQECELIRSALPEVMVLQIPERTEELARFLQRRHIFDALSITEDDKRRTLSYQQNRERRDLSATFGDLSEYKAKLDTRLQVQAARREDRPRLVQLIQRTNQFNLTTRRYSDADVAAFMESDDAIVVAAMLSDHFGALGVIGCAIILREGEDADVDTMLMSCRALGRDAELAFAAAIYSLVASRWNSRRLTARFVPTLKNAPALDFWERAGLSREGSPGSDGCIGYVSSLALPELAAAIAPAHVTLELI